MSLAPWKCCGRNYTAGIKTCRLCGAPKKAYGVLDDKPKPTPTKAPAKKRKPRRKGPDPLISLDEDRLYVSTMKRIGE